MPGLPMSGRVPEPGTVHLRRHRQAGRLVHRDRRLPSLREGRRRVGLAEPRERAGLAQAEVAARMGTARPNVSRLEGLPVREVGQRQLRRYLSALGADLVLVVTASAGDEIALTAP
ncbi:XRE family transcriptional regulator [Streptomyces sp. DT224]|uniref:XRE family transcriptional regulator n=1 Tax=Streptomyces sp. DT224 TaxID=3393426 RepID=UPI003CF78931